MQVLDAVDALAGLLVQACDGRVRPDHHHVAARRVEAHDPLRSSHAEVVLPDRLAAEVRRVQVRSAHAVDAIRPVIDEVGNRVIVFEHLADRLAASHEVAVRPRTARLCGRGEHHEAERALGERQQPGAKTRAHLPHETSSGPPLRHGSGGRGPESCPQRRPFHEPPSIFEPFRHTLRPTALILWVVIRARDRCTTLETSLEAS